MSPSCQGVGTEKLKRKLKVEGRGKVGRKGERRDERDLEGRKERKSSWRDADWRRGERVRELRRGSGWRLGERVWVVGRRSQASQ